MRSQLGPRFDFHINPSVDGRISAFGNQGYIPAMHRHDELELDIATRGRAAFLLADRKYSMRPGTISWIFPGQEHVIFEQSADYEMWVCIFKPGVVARACTQPSSKVLCENDPPGFFARRISSDRLAALTQVLDGLRSARRADVARFNAGLAYVLLSAWWEYQAAEAAEPKQVHPAVTKAAKLMRTAGEPLKLTEIAAQVGLAPSRLRELFKEQMGVSAVHYRQHQQLQRFVELYGDGKSRTMLDAVLEAGFGSYPQFHRVFRRTMGYAPAEYRRRMSKIAH